MKKRNVRLGFFFVLVAASVLAAAFYLAPHRFRGGTFIIQKLRGKATVSDRLAQYGPAAQARWKPYFEKAKLAYPPQKILLIGLKQEKELQVYAADNSQSFTFIRSYPIQKLSGKLGPKLRFGDFQVPEGFYRIESLNPNSAYHLALRIDYPNEFDRVQATKDGRTELGGDIMIHGSDVSVGCLAMGDEVVEDLFVLAAEVGAENIEVILSPLDFRRTDIPKDANRPAWIEDLYAQIKVALKKLPE